MGLRSFSSLLVIFLLVALLFGTKKLREIGGDLAAAVKSFKKGLQEEDEKPKQG